MAAVATDGVGRVPAGAEEADLTEVRILEARLAAFESQTAATHFPWQKSDSFALRIGGLCKRMRWPTVKIPEDQLDGATGQPLNETRFVIRRARLRAEAEARYVGGALELDGNTVGTTQVRLLGGRGVCSVSFARR